MTSPDLIEALETLPAVIHMVSGRAVRVTNRKLVLVSPTGQMVAVALENGAITTLATYNIESVTPEFPPDPAAQAVRANQQAP